MKLAPGNITGNLTISGTLTAGKIVNQDPNGPIGSLIASYTGPGSTVTAANTTATVGTFTANLVAGLKYLLTGFCIVSVSTGSPTFINSSISDSAGLIVPPFPYFLSVANPSATALSTGCVSFILAPGSNVTDTFTIKLTDSGASTSAVVNTNSVQAQIIRVA